MREAKPEAALPMVLLYGPPFGRRIARGYGGGAGGYTRNMQVYLSSLDLGGTRLAPLCHTVRGERSRILETFPARMVTDCWRIAKAVLGERPDLLHVLASYRKALPREIFLAALCRLWCVKFVYDVKAGEFARAYERGGWAYRAAIRYILGSANAVLVEGRADQVFLADRCGIQSVYFPNFVPMIEVPVEVPQRLAGRTLKLLYVGYCYEGKGVRTLLEGCALAARSGLRIEASLIGEEEAAFKVFADRFEPPPSMSLKRLGRRPHDDVLAAMAQNDIYCYPSAHPGEGHNNSINEAMMYGMVIITTRQGFLGDVLSEDAAYFLDRVTAGELAKTLIAIAGDGDRARKKASRARSWLKAEFTSTQASERLRTAYARALAELPRPKSARDIRSVPR